MLLAIETSCDETAVALVDLEAFFASGKCDQRSLKADIIASQIEVHKPYGGVVPELASRQHLANLPVVVHEALSQADCSIKDVTAIAVTRGPGLKGCLLIGMSYAKALSFTLGIPMYGAHHMEGHLFAAELGDCGELPYPFLSLVVSGGHTLLVWAESYRNYQIIAQTRDDAAGEAFDKIATMLHLPYPGGPSLSKRAALGDDSVYEFPLGMKGEPSFFSYSGLKTSVLRQVHKLGNEIEKEEVINNISACAEKAIVDTLVEKTRFACENYKPKALILTGGVAANKRLRLDLENLSKLFNIEYRVPAFRWCTDNAAMIAALSARYIERNKDEYRGWRPTCGKFLGPNTPMDIGAIARWPLTELTL